MSTNEDIIIQKLAEHEEKLDQVVTDIAEFKNEFTTASDQMITILKRLDEERLATINWIRRLEDDIEKSKTDISKIKEHLHIQ